MIFDNEHDSKTEFESRITFEIPEDIVRSGWLGGFPKSIGGRRGSRREIRSTTLRATLFSGLSRIHDDVPTAPSPSGEVIEQYEAYAKKAALEVVGRAVTIAEKRGIKAKAHTTETIGSAVQVITDYAASEKIDLIVVGTRGMGGFKKMLLGSVSSGVVTHAPCTVLVVR